MSAETPGSIAAQLLAHGAAGDTGVAIVEQATTPYQQVHTATLEQYAAKLGNLSLKSPSLVIIGKVVALHQQFAWLPTNSANETYFNPVAGRLVAYGKDAKRA